MGLKPKAGDASDGRPRVGPASMYVLYYHFHPGLQRPHPAASVQDVAEAFGARCEVEADEDGIGVTVHAPEVAAAALRLLLWEQPLWSKSP